MKRSKYAHIGEKVRLVTVKRFIRCGYPLDRKLVMEKFSKEIEELRVKAVNAILGQLPFELSWTAAPCLQDRLADAKLEDAIVFYILRRAHFGGKERQIFEEDLLVDSYDAMYFHAGSVGTVISKKIVYTGKYYPPYGGYSGYGGEYDWEPGGLENSKAHCVYTLNIKDCEFLTLADHCERIQNLDTGGVNDSQGTSSEAGRHRVSNSHTASIG